MRLSVHLPLKDNAGNPLDAEGVMQRARAIEAAGFSGIWIGDGPAGRPDPLMWLLVAAAATERVELGTSIFQVPFREPVDLAQRVMTLHQLSNGRFVFGVGAGGNHSTFSAFGQPDGYPERFRRLQENLSTIQHLCRGEVVGDADFGRWSAARGGPPIIIGTWSSDIWLRRAATQYDGWIASGAFNRAREAGGSRESTLKTLGENLQRFRDYGGGRTVVSTILMDLSQPERALADDEPFNLNCGPRSAAERLERLATLGFDEAFLVKRQTDRNAAMYEADFDEGELETIRGLLPSE